MNFQMKWKLFKDTHTHGDGAFFLFLFVCIATTLQVYDTMTTQKTLTLCAVLGGGGSHHMPPLSPISGVP
jgi:hypothetical protein